MIKKFSGEKIIVYHDNNVYLDDVYLKKKITTPEEKSLVELNLGKHLSR